ncbi:cysteine desulfurase family protein [Olsenella sp. An293]|uniref:cysteine desulfurase family protein n=1 Tax=Olsenella sp. An293 TaxID=1965626 RepID=UPI000B384621|nr:cysteine desulfurase family protein [Olsenella sp. An293]OUO33972.1 aminotransferase [Olsenella sp. An293]
MAAPKREVYLDYAAATPVDPEVAAAMLPYLTERFWNPSAPYARAREARDDVERARGSIARLIGARPDNLVFTAGATEANNLAFAAVEGHVVVDAIEHESVLACAGTHARRTVRVGADGLVDPSAVARAIRPETELVSIELANGEIGCVQPVREVARVVAAERARRLEAGEGVPIYLHTDASQAAGALSVNVSSLGVDLLTLSAAKIYGPKQVGLLWASDDVRLRPLVYGGGQEGGVRSGTENVAGIVGFARALELACERRSEETRRLAALRERLRTGIHERVGWAVVSGPRNPKRRLPGLLHVSFAGIEARRLVIALERAGVSAGTGSACAASRMRVSHVLEAIGMPRPLAEGSLRLTLGRPTTERDVDYAAAAIGEAVRAEAARLGLDDAAQASRVAALLEGWRGATSHDAQNEPGFGPQNGRCAR